MKRALLAITAALCVAPLVAGAAPSADRHSSIGRALTPEDLLEVQTVAGLELSPDGAWVATTVVRPHRPGERNRLDLEDVQRADIWIARTDGGPARNVTGGAADAAGFWSVKWSPDGRRLAMLSTRGGDNVRLYVWARATGELRRLTEEGVDLSAQFLVAGEVRPQVIAWRDTEHLLAVVLPARVTPLRFRESELTGSLEAAAAATVLKGSGGTAVVWSSGDPSATIAQPSTVASLVSIDVASGLSKTLTELPVSETRLAYRTVVPSEDGRYAAVVVTGEPLPLAAATPIVTGEMFPPRLGLISLVDRGEVRWLTDLRPVFFNQSGSRLALRWASDDRLAVVGVPSGGARVDPDVFVVNAATTPVEQMVDARDELGRAIDARDVRWTATGALLVGGTLRAESERARESPDPVVRRMDRAPGSIPRDQWWMVTPSGVLRDLVSPSEMASLQLHASLPSGELIASGEGKLWIIEPQAGMRRMVRAPDGVSVLDIDSPGSSFGSLPVSSQVVLRTSGRRTGKHTWYEVDFSGPHPKWREMVSAPDTTRLARFSRASGGVTYVTADTRVCSKSARRGSAVELLSLNRFLDSVAPPVYETVRYETAGGQQLIASLLLPRGYVKGRRYPLVVVVYGGSHVSAVGRDDRHVASYLSPLVLAGQGYAVLEPSIPLAPPGIPSDPLFDLDNGVEPAVAKVIEMGVADADRVGVMGTSYGGYTTAGLIARSRRYRAAVAVSGIYDLVSSYGTVDLRYRYTPNGLAARLGAYGAESQQLRMGVPPWRDPERYWRNSPLAHVERIEAPLLLIHGSVDSVPMGGAEEMFVALNRLGKRAELVRYLGEGHQLESPANIVDAWQRILGWFATHLEPESRASH